MLFRKIWVVISTISLLLVVPLFIYSIYFATDPLVKLFIVFSIILFVNERIKERWKTESETYKEPNVSNTFEPQNAVIITAIIFLVLLFFTNPSPTRFRDHLSNIPKDELYREHNLYIFSIYNHSIFDKNPYDSKHDNIYNDRYIGILGTFIQWQFEAQDWYSEPNPDATIVPRKYDEE